MPRKFLISVLALDGLDMTRRCIESVFASNNQDFILMLTDNASKDGTAEYFNRMASSRPDVVVVHNKENKGFIDPNNRAFAFAQQCCVTYFICLNNDVCVPPEWLDKFAECMDNNPKAAIAGPEGTCSQVDTQMVGNSAARYEYVEGSVFCAKISILSLWPTLFSPDLKFIYMDDLETSLRVQRAGYTIHRLNFRVTHKNGSTCTRHPDAIAKCRDAMAHNQAVMLKKWAHWNKTRRFDTPILVKRAGAAGDVLLTTPIIRALHELWPLCPIDVETGVPDIYKGNPLVRSAAHRVVHDGWTRVIDLNGSYERTPDRHVLLSYAEAADVDPATVPMKTDLYFAPTDAETLTEGRWCAMHVGATTWPGKNWHVSRFNEVAQIMRAAGWKILFFGAPSREVVQVDIDRRGQNGIQELAALIAQCELFIGVDSFPMHVAQAVGVPVVALFGITDPKCFLTGGSPAMAVCSDPAHPDTGRRNREANKTFLYTTDAVMRTISVEQVMAAVSEMSAKEAVK